MTIKEISMSTVIARVLREPVALAGVVTAGLGLATVLGLDPPVAGSIGMLLGALIALGRSIVTPTSEVVLQDGPNGLVAGPASTITTGQPVRAEVIPISRNLPQQRRGRRRRRAA